jgi:hypothetical protein
MSKIEQTLRKNLIAIAVAYQKGTGLSWPTIGKNFYGKSSFFPELRRRPIPVTISKFGEMVDQFRKEWPDGVDWPFLPIISMDRDASPRKR